MEVLHEIPRLALHEIQKPPSRSFKFEKKMSDEEIYLSELPKRFYEGIGYLGSPKPSQNFVPDYQNKSYLSRTLSNPFIHSWEYNNVDASLLIYSPRVGSLNDVISLRWKKEVMNLLLIETGLSNDSLLKKLNFLCAETKEEQDHFELNMSEIRNRGLKMNPVSKSRYELNSGSPNSIIRSLIDNTLYVKSHISSILLTHEYWTLPSHIFSKLISTFWFQKGNLFSSLRNLESDPILKACIQKRILKVLSLWINRQPYDFDNDHFRKDLQDFIRKMKQTKAVSKNILNIFVKLVQNIKREIPDSITNQDTSSYLTFLEINPREYAKQLCLFNANLLSKVDIRDLRNWNNSKKSKEICEKSIKFQNWVMTEILSCVDMNKRIIILGNFIQLCQYSLDLHDFHSTFDIFHALNHVRITKICSVWKGLSEMNMKIWESLKQKIFSDADFFDLSLEANFPKVLPFTLCIKFISILEKEPAFLSKENKILNFSRLKGIHEILKPLSDSQRHSYKIQKNPDVQNFLSFISGLNEGKLDFLSKEIEIAHGKRIQFSSFMSSRASRVHEQSSSSHSLSAREKNSDRIIVPRKTTSVQIVRSLKKRSAEDINKSVNEEVKEKWQRSLDKCSVGQDLPRFASKITIVAGDDELLKPKEKEKNVSHTIRKLLFIIAGQLSAKKEIYAMETSFSLFFEKENSDILKESDRFVKEVFGEKSRVSSLLKAACTQGIVSPAWIKLKMEILDGFPFKDHKKGWNIAIIFSSEKIIVVHRKQEISVNDNNEVQFGFTWELTLTFSKKMESMLNSSLAIVDIDIQHLPEKRVATLKAAIKPWYLPKNSKFPSTTNKKLKRRSFHDLKSSKKRLSLPVQNVHKLNDTNKF